MENTTYRNLYSEIYYVLKYIIRNLEIKENKVEVKNIYNNQNIELKNLLKGIFGYYKFINKKNKKEVIISGFEGKSLQNLPICKISNVINSNLELFRKIYEQLLNNILKDSRYVKILVNAKLMNNSRLSINTASGWGKEIFEVGIHIHPIYSIPFIPSSSIKGAFRRSFKELSNKIKFVSEEEDLKALELILLGSFIDKNNKLGVLNIENIQNKEIRKIIEDFIDKDEKSIDEISGNLIFFDAFPYKININNGKIEIECPKDILILDIINRHYDENEYFSDDLLKSGEYISPNPIIFYSIKENTPFTLIFLIRKNIWEKSTIIKTSIITTLEYMLKITGLGAKTTYGYGRFNIDKIIIKS